MKRLSSEKGQTIIEAIVALAAIFVIVTAITIAIISAVSNSQFIKNQNLANKYAQQGMEFVRGIHAEDIETFASFSQTYSYGDDGGQSCVGTNIRGLCAGEVTTVNVGNAHIRTINFVDDEEPCLDNVTSINLKKVTVVVSWSSGKCGEDDRFCHDTTLVSCIPYQRDVGVFP